MLSFADYRKRLALVEDAAAAVPQDDNTLEAFFEEMEKRGIALETVVTGDCAQFTAPMLQVLKPRQVWETAPPNPKIEKFINAHKDEFKKRYGNRWERIIYSLAWKMHNKGK